MAAANGVVWVATGDAATLQGDFRLARVDPETAEVTASIGLGRRVPKALVASGGDVWVIASDGMAFRVEAGT